VLPLVVPLAERLGKPIRTWSNEDWVRAAAELAPNSPAPPRVRFQNAAASLLTTASDYARFLTLLMDRTEAAPWELREGTRRAMISPQIAVSEGGPLWWGLGWCLESSSGRWRVSHEGNNDGRFTSYAGFDPAARRGLVVLTNGGSGFGVYQRIVREATGLDQLSFIANMDPPREEDHARE
jgi:CubicO group peptidase (beta-lactamase class C family)